MAFKLILGLSFVVLASALPSKPAFWKGTALDSHVEKMRSACAQDDTIACFQYKAFAFLDNILQKDYFQFGDSVQVNRNTYASNEVSSRSGDSIEEGVEEFIKSHDVKFTLPLIGDVTVDSKALDNQEIDLKLNFGSGSAVEARKKSKLKKIFIPILVFLLLKAITLVPLAIGILGLKAWNGLQLAFFSFIISTGLAIFQLCQKLAVDSAHSTAHISAAGPWESPAVSHYAARNLDESQKMAYSAYVQ